MKARERAACVIKTLEGSWQTLECLALKAGLVNTQMARFLSEHLFGKADAVPPFVERTISYHGRKRARARADGGAIGGIANSIQKITYQS